MMFKRFILLLAKIIDVILIFLLMIALIVPVILLFVIIIVIIYFVSIVKTIYERIEDWVYPPKEDNDANSDV